MTKVNPLQPALNAGEFSPRMAARVDFEKYPAASRSCKNMLPIPQGGAMRRSGSRYVAAVKTGSLKTRLMRFEFSTTQAYVLEAGNAYFRFYRNQGAITSANITASITNGQFGTNISGWTDRSTGSGSIAHDSDDDDMNLVPGGTGGSDIGWAEQEITNSSAIEHILLFRVRGAPGDRIQLRIGTASTGTQLVSDVLFKVGYHAYAFTATAANFFVQFRNVGSFRNKTVSIDDISMLDNATMEIQTPYLTADLFQLKTAQSADVLYIMHPTYAPHKLSRTGHTTWSLEEIAWDDGPYLDENITDTTLVGTTSGLSQTLTASAIEGINNDTGFSTDDIGRSIRLRTTAAEAGWGVIVNSTSTTTVRVDIRRAFPTTSASAFWTLGSWSPETGYPGAVAFFEQRLAAARSTGQPQTFWLSQKADLENQRPDTYDSGVNVEADDAMNFTLAADQANAIQWLSPGKQLALGTSGGVWVAESDGPELAPTDIQVRRQTTNGAADMSPARVDDVVLYLQRGKRRVREFAFVFEVDSFQAPDLTILSDHITKTGITEFAYQEEPDSVVWCVRDDGVLASMTYRRNENVVGWARQILGGTFNTGDAVVESVETVPGNDGSGQQFNSVERNEVWVIVKRTVGGTTVRTIEFLEQDFEGPVRQDYTTEAIWKAAVRDAQQDAFYVDSGLSLDTPITVTGASTTSPVVITAASHGFVNGNLVRHRAILGMVEANDIQYKVANKTTNTYELTDPDDDSDIDGTSFTAYDSGGEVRLETTSISGLTHLEGETVKVWANGAVHPDKTVASGAITLDYEASKVHVGLGYENQIETLKMNAGARRGTAVAKTKRIDSVTMILLDASNTKIGPDSANLKEVEFRVVSDPMSLAVPVFTGEKYIEFDGDYETDPKIVIQSDAPGPFTLLGLAPELKVNETT